MCPDPHFWAFFCELERLKELKSQGIRAEIDIRNEKIGYKIREHSNSKIPIIMAIGKKEAKEKTVSVRRLGNQTTKIFKLKDFITDIKQELKILN